MVNITAATVLMRALASHTATTITTARSRLATELATGGPPTRFPVALAGSPVTVTRTDKAEVREGRFREVRAKAKCTRKGRDEVVATVVAQMVAGCTHDERRTG